MFGKDYKPQVVDAIYKAIESEKRVIEQFKKEIIKEIEGGKAVIAPLAHMTYFNLKRESVEVQNASSREMYQALNSIATHCKYDGEKDQCSGTIGDFTLDLSRGKDSYGSYVTVSAMPSMSTISQVANQVISDQKTQSNINSNESDNSHTLPAEEIKVISTENRVEAVVDDVVVSAGKFCTQCGTENINEAKFCKSCGYSLIEKELSSNHEQSTIKAELPPDPKVAEVTPAVEQESKILSSWSGWLLLIPVIAWVLYRLVVLAGGNIALMFGLMTIPNVVAEALGGAAAIIGIPLIATTIIYLIKKTQDAQYVNFVKHTLISSIILLGFGIAANINTIRDEQKVADMQTTSEIVDANYAVAVDAAAPAEAAPVLSEVEQAE